MSTNERGRILWIATAVDTEADAHRFALLHGRDSMLGVIGLHAHQPEAFSETDAERFSDWARSVGIAVENLCNFQQAEQLTLRNPLTGAFNRRYFEQSLAKEYSRYERHSEGFALALADVDDVKRINDPYGHTADDQAPIRIIELLVCRTRGADAVCRIAGDAVHGLRRGAGQRGPSGSSDPLRGCCVVPSVRTLAH